jgi:hypothetical protein
LAPKPIFERGEAGGVAARAGQALHEAGADRVRDEREHDRHMARHLEQFRQRRRPSGQDHVGRQCNELRRKFAGIGDIGGAPSIVDLQVAAFAPP